MIQNPQNQNPPTDSTNNNPTENPRISIIVNSFNGDHSPRGSQDAERNREIIKWNRTAAKTSIIYSFLTFLLVLASAYSIYEARNAVDAANRAADAATKQAGLSDDAEKKGLRAYVSLRDIKLEPFDPTAFDIVPEWENTGGTQTVYMTAHLNWLPTPGPLPSNFSFGDVRSVDRPITLGAKQVSHVSFVKAAKSCLNAFNAGTDIHHIYIWTGKIF
jgi:hypothetical protein